MKKRNLVLIFIVCLYSITLQAQVQIGSSFQGDNATDRLGFAISMPSATTIGIGAYNNDVSEGYIKIFTLYNNEWVQKGETISSDVVNDNVGGSFSMPDENTIAIGCSGSSANGYNSGKVNVYSWNGSSWIQKGASILGEAAYDGSGISVSMPDENTVAIGANGNDGDVGIDSDVGHVRVFSWDGSQWIQKGGDIDGENPDDRSGWPVSMPDANTVASGAYYNTGSFSHGGHVRVFEWSNTDWVQKGNDIDGIADGENAGWSISMPNANTVALGAIGYNGSSTAIGQVRIYGWDGSEWVQKGEGIDGEAAYDQSGFSISMPDENAIAIGSIFNQGNGEYSGHVRVYKWVGNSWVKYGSDIDGVAVYNFEGFAVSMPDSKTVATGAPYNNDNGTEAGQVRVFSVCDSYSYYSQEACVSYLSPSGNYSWTSSGLHNDTIPNSLGCDSIISINLTIIGVDISVTNSSPVLIANAEEAQFQWLDCDNNYAVINGEISSIFTATSIGNYAVEVLQNGCIDTSECITVTTISIPELTNEDEVYIYPNPAGERIKIVSLEPIFEIELLNVSGKELLHLESVNEIDVQSFPPGIYILQFKTDKLIIRRSIVIL